MRFFTGLLYSEATVCMLIYKPSSYVLSCRGQRCFQILLAGYQFTLLCSNTKTIPINTCQSPTYTAICTRLSGLITCYKDDSEASIMVIVLVLIGVTILQTGSKPLKCHR